MKFTRSDRVWDIEVLRRAIVGGTEAYSTTLSSDIWNIGGESGKALYSEWRAIESMANH